MISFEFKVGEKVKMIKTISTVEGTLYKGTIVKIVHIGFPDKDLEVKDPVGKLWYVDYEEVEVIK